MSDDTQLALVSRILEDSALDEQALSATLGQLLTRRVDYADLYFQLGESERWTLEDGIVRDAGFSRVRGVGVRAVGGDKTGFAYADDLDRAALSRAADAARAIVRQGQDAAVPALATAAHPVLYRAESPLTSMPDSSKTALLKSLDERIRALDPRVEQVTVSLAASYDDILVAGSDGTFAADARPMARINVMVIAAENGRREQGYAGGGGRYALDADHADALGMQLGEEAVRQALVQLEAVDAPAGLMPVVLGPGWPAVLLHEAIGHGLEGDFNRKGTSAFSNRIGDRVASELCTVVDDGTLPDRRGSLSIDDEGTPSQCTVLIEDGILRGIGRCA